MCIGARDRSHIAICGLFGRRKLLWCFKGFYSIVLKIVARANFRILTATVGHAENSHDSTIMIKHSFWQKREEIFPPGARVIEGVQVPFLEIGGSASFSSIASLLLNRLSALLNNVVEPVFINLEQLLIFGCLLLYACFHKQFHIWPICDANKRNKFDLFGRQSTFQIE